MSDGDALQALLSAIEDAQARIHAAIRGAGPPRAEARPADRRWSALENVRHLVFAEQVHLGPVLSGPQPWNPLGLDAGALARQRRARMLTEEQAPALADVLGAWSMLHAEARRLLLPGSPGATAALTKNLRHLGGHLGTVERLLRPAG